MENNRLLDTYESKNILTSMFFRTKISLIIFISKLKKEDIILDFGCGGGWLEKKLEKYKIYGYDVNPEKTFIKNYKTIKPTKIFALDVFEHMKEKEIQATLDEFKKLNNQFNLIVSIPTGNWLSRRIRKIVGKSEVPKEHITSYSKVLDVIKRNFILRRKMNFLTITHLFVFSYKR